MVKIERFIKGGDIQILRIMNMGTTKERVTEDFLRGEFKDAVEIVAPVFRLNPREDLMSDWEPYIDLWNEPGSIRGTYSPDTNSLWIDPRYVNRYEIGGLAGSFLYHAVNPGTYESFREYLKRSLEAHKKGDAKRELELSALRDAHLVLDDLVRHYSGRVYHDRAEYDSRLPELEMVDVSKIEDPDTRTIASVIIQIRRRAIEIADTLYGQHEPRAFSELVTLSFDEAAFKIGLLTGKELMFGQ